MCSTVKMVPEAQSRGIRDGVRPYLNASVSVKVPLCRQNPNYSMCRIVSQFEAALSLASSIILLLVLDRRASGSQLLVQLAGVSVDGLSILLSAGLPDTGKDIHLLVCDNQLHKRLKCHP